MILTTPSRFFPLLGRPAPPYHWSRVEDQGGLNHAARHRETLARKIRAPEEAARRGDRRRRHEGPRVRRRVGLGRHGRGPVAGLGRKGLSTRHRREVGRAVQEARIRDAGVLREREEEPVMNITFKDKVALVTGAASGLGLATAKAFAESGASVVLADWNEKAARSAADELVAQGHKTLAIQCDVSDDAQVEAMVGMTVQTFGRLDAAYNNAGVQNILADTADSPRDDYDRVMAINLGGVWSCMKFELRQMRKQGSGAIVNCSSLGGLGGGAGRGTYHAAKHGVLGLTKSAALEYAARGIRINAVCPGLIQTPMSDQMVAAGQADALREMMKDVPIGRVGRAEEIADAVLWLCSSAASLVVGHALAVDGGYTIR